MNSRTVRLIAFLLLALSPLRGLAARPAGADAAFREAFDTIASADELRQVGNLAGARELYGQAGDRLRALAEQYPDWQSGMVQFRMEYCAKQAARLADEAVPATAARTERASLPPPRQRLPTTGAATAAPTGDTAALCRQARGHLMRAEPDQARRVLLDALALSPDDFSTRSLLAITQCLLGRYHDAALLLEELLTETPNDIDVRVALAAAYAGQERYSDAVAQLRQAIARAPDRHDPHFNLAQILSVGEHPDWAAAREHYRRSVELGGEQDAEFEALIGNAPATPGQ